MDELLTPLREWMGRPELRAAVLIVGSILLAKIVDWFICTTLRRWTRRSKTDLDDRLIELLHRPIFISVVLFGLYLAHGEIASGNPYTWLVNALLKTLGLLIWISAII